MKFAEPIWLLLGLAVISTLIWLYRRYDARQRQSLADFASSHLIAKLTASFSPACRMLKRALFLAAVGFIFMALARPQFGYHWEEQKSRGIDILFAIDTSKSMLTQDVNPDRLTRAKLAISDLVKKLDGDRVGLIAFAGDAFLQAPLTVDGDAFQESLDAVTVRIIPRGGTDVASAIQEAQSAFGTEGKNKKILVLITDGEDLEAKGIDAARAAAKDGLTVYTVGVGSASGGLIPITNPDGGTDFLKDSSGQFVKSHLDENTLKQIAEATGGLYEPLGQQGEGLETIYNQALAPLPKQDLASRSQKVYDEWFQWPLTAGLACLLASLFIGTRKNVVRKVPVAVPKKARQLVATIMGTVVLGALCSSAQASPQSAEQAYKKGDFTTAEKQYETAVSQSPQVAPLQFDLGTAAYKTSEYDKALPAFQKALNTDELNVQQHAYYDIGNTQYRLGQKTEKSAPPETIKTWQGAVQSYDAALKLKPDDADAKFNRDFVEKKLEQLQKQQDQQKQKQQKSDSKQNQQDQKQNQPDQQKSSSQQNQQDQKQGQQNQQKSGSQQNPGSQNSQQNQPGQPKDQQDQKPTESDGKQNDSLGKNGEQPAGPRGQTIPDKGSPKPQPTAGNEPEKGAPGEMTLQEAKDLLNSLKNGEHALPVTADTRNGANHSADDQPLKDW